MLSACCNDNYIMPTKHLGSVSFLAKFSSKPRADYDNELVMKEVDPSKLSPEITC